MSKDKYIGTAVLSPIPVVVEFKTNPLGALNTFHIN
jgi:hypothetical protein